MTEIDWVDEVTPLDAEHMDALEQVARKAKPNGYASLGADGKVPAAQLPPAPAPPDLSPYQLRSEEGVANGYASLDAGVKVPVAQLPDLSATYQPRSEEGQANGYASLDGTGKVPVAQLPPYPVVPPVDDTTLPTRLRTGAGPYAVSDFNLATASGWYYTTGSAPNGPSTGGDAQCHVLVSAYGNTWLVQYAVHLTSNQMWMRRNNGGTWQAWIKLSPLDDANLPNRLGSYAASGQVLTALGGVGSVIDATSNCDWAMRSGWYFVYPGAVNNPVANWGMIRVDNQDGGSAKQTYWEHNSMRQYQRQTATSGVWSAWTQTWPITNAVLPVMDNTTLPARLRTTAGGGNTVNDLNAIRESGWFGANNGAVGAPAGVTYGNVEVVVWDPTGYATQKFYDLYTTRVWKRACTGGWGSWTAWEQVWPPTDGAPWIGGRLQGTGTVANDCNAATSDGWYYTLPTSANKPPGDTYYGMLVVNVSSTVHCRQIAYDYQSDNVYMRRSLNSVWGGWQKVWPQGQRTVGGSSVVTTDGNAEAWIDTTTYTNPYGTWTPQTVVVTNGDPAVRDDFVISTKDLGATGFRIKLRSITSGTMPNQIVRVNWVMTGNFT